LIQLKIEIKLVERTLFEQVPSRLRR